MTQDDSQLAELGLKAFASIAPILSQVLGRTKDKEARALLEQMQIRYNEAQSGIFAAQRDNADVRSQSLKIEHENFELKREIANLKDAHAEAMVEKDREIANLKKDSAEEVATLKKSHAESEERIHKHYSDPNRNSPFSSGLGGIENII